MPDVVTWIFYIGGGVGTDVITWIFYIGGGVGTDVVRCAFSVIFYVSSDVEILDFEDGADVSTVLKMTYFYIGG